MNLEINADQFNKNVKFVSLTNIKASELEPRVQKDKATRAVIGMKNSPNGNATYSLSNIQCVAGDEVVKNCYLSVEKPIDLQPLQFLQLVGTVWVDHYSTRDGLLTVICAEGIEPVSGGDKGSGLPRPITRNGEGA